MTTTNDDLGIIRSASLADLGALTALKQFSARRAYGPLADPLALESWLSLRASATSIHTKLDDPNCTVVVTSDSFGDLAGMATVTLQDDDTANFADLYCREDSRGVGSALYAYCESLASAQGASGLICHCFESNVRALQFFTDRGFLVTRSVTTDDDLGAGNLLELELLFVD